MNWRRRADAPAPGDDMPAEKWRGIAQLFLAIADVRIGRIDEAQRRVRQTIEDPAMREVSVRSFMRDLRQYDDADLMARERRFAEDLRQAGRRDL